MHDCSTGQAHIRALAHAPAMTEGAPHFQYQGRGAMTPLVAQRCYESRITEG